MQLFQQNHQPGCDIWQEWTWKSPPHKILMRWLLLCLFIFQPISIGQEVPQRCLGIGSMHQVFCGNLEDISECTPELWLCDGRRDCSTGYDESPATCQGVDPCTNVTCYNGGTCVGFSYQRHRSVAYHTCKCMDGYFGSSCDLKRRTLTNINMAQYSQNQYIYKYENIATFKPNSTKVATTSLNPVLPTQTPVTIEDQRKTLAIAAETTANQYTTPVGILFWEPYAAKVNTNISKNITVHGHSISKRSTEQNGVPLAGSAALTPRAAIVPNVSLCFPNPCFNGVCTPLWAGFHCTCRPGYAGPTCKMSVDACASQPCLNGGSCFPTPSGDRTFRCSCRRGYTSRQCEVDINECASNPCLNGATCKDLQGVFECNCRLGFTGTRCEVNIQECSSNPCYLLEGGSCQDGINMFTCQCPSFRAGEFCQRRQLCQQDRCLNHGICFPASVGGGAPSCQCLPGYTGQLCETNINDCVGKNCGNGQCVDGVRSHRCVCNEGFTGASCEVRIDPCLPNPCQNNGYCCRSGKAFCAASLPITYFECYCTGGFTGSRCERSPDPCSPEPCRNGGLCNHVGSTFACTCPLNFNGSTCESPVPCASSPCFNNGTCSDLGNGGFQCSCSDKFQGTYCESTVPCQNNPCLNGGQCVNRDNGYSCVCPGGFSGVNCEIYVPCASTPCRNGGQCSPTSGSGFRCTCSSNFTGNFCERYLPCTSQPCQNNGTCLDFNGQYRCECLVGITGQNCEIIQACSSLPCSNGGTCVPSGSSFVCSCRPGYTGARCQTLLACSSSPCANGGTCTDVGSTGFSCTCPPTYTGTQCTVQIACSGMPCRNSGTCVPTSTGFSCLCTPAYTGSRCEVFRTCTSQPCLNQGTCVQLVSGQFQCQCGALFTGRVCETPMLCFPNPCLSGGRCNVLNNEVSCSCVAPFTGPRCESRDSCATLPCQNGGYCVNLASGYRCLCSASYSGTNCETFLQCSSQPCMNNGQCAETQGSYQCTCNQIYGGRNCENFIPCGSNPCMNGADCIDRGLTYECQCRTYYVGRNCETALACASSPCMAGICNNAGDSYVCQCDARYTGPKCDVPIVCDASTCLNGNCQLVSGVGMCVCNTGFTGTDCESRISQCTDPCTPPCECTQSTSGDYVCQCPTPITTPSPPSNPFSCDSSPCFNGGRCIASDSGHYCQCTVPFTGDRCHKRVGACDSQPCMNNGRCIAEDGLTYRCICQPPWTGDICQSEIRSCALGPCQNSGSCRTDSLGVYCVCPAGFDGLFCQLLNGICSPNPCFGGGQCVQINGTVVCDCPRGREGSRCETSVVGCIPNPCNEGNCVENSQGKFQCSCPPELVGSRCQIRNPCSSQPCHNGGTCIAAGSTFSCTCPAGFSGPTCDGILPRCASQPCFNGGTCTPNTASSIGFVCSCVLGYSGSQCEKNIDDCTLGSPRCANGGTCRDLVNGIRCDCATGFSGTTCTVRDNCATQPCGSRGTCLNVPNLQHNVDYTCVCTPEYEGVNCAQFRYCSSSPCQNGGTCTNLPAGFSCSCAASYTGSTCAQQIVGCNGITCNGRGTCIPQGLFGYTCNCTEGYVGQDCETSSCGTQPCQNEGVCKRVDGPKVYICQCTGPRVGDRCQLGSTSTWPQFSGLSYVTLPPVSGLSLRTAVEVRFRPSSGNGLLLYVGHSDIQTGDFMALVLEQQIPVFRLNLGSGILTLRGAFLTLNQWHTIKITRTDRNTDMDVNGIRVQGQAPPGTVGLTLETTISVGGVKNASLINLNAQYNEGFQGCIHDVKVGQVKPAVLPWSNVLESQDIVPCSSDPCTTNICRNGGMCLLGTNMDYSCHCAVGWGGTNCSSSVAAPASPAFSRNSYIIYNVPSLSGQDLYITLAFRSTSQDGLIMYSSDANDFFALFIAAGTLHFAFDLGSGSVTLNSVSKVVLNSWQTVDIVRSGKRGQMKFGSDQPVLASALGPNLGLDVGMRTFIGGIPMTLEARAEVTAAVGFSGCVKDVAIQRQSVDLTMTAAGFGIVPCMVSPCEGHQCASGSTCRATTTSQRGYECVCPPGQTGTFCEAVECTSGAQCANGGRCISTSVTDSECLCTYQWTGPTCTQELRFTIASFKSVGYLAYPNADFIGFQFVQLEIVFRTQKKNGLLAWVGKASGEFVGLAVRNSLVEVSANLGGGVGNVVATLENVTDLQWVKVKLVISGTYISLETDRSGQTTSYFGRAPGSDNQLTVDSQTPLYVGGLPGNVAAGTGLLYTEAFSGCIIQLRAAKLPNQYKDIRLKDDALSGVGVTACQIS